MVFNKKIIAVLLIVFLIVVLIQFNVTGWVTRTISSSQDNKETMICNSKGNCWPGEGKYLQEAVDDLGVQGGKVWLPEGTLNLDALDNESYPGSRKALLLKDNVFITGSGIGATILETTESDIYPIWSIGKQNITMSDFTLDMHSTGGNAIILESSENVLLEKLQIRNPGAAGIRTSGNSTRIILDRIHVDNVQLADRHAFSLFQVHNSIFNDLIATNVAQGYGLDMAEASNCTTSNVLIQNASYGMKVVGTEWDTRNCNFNNINIINAFGNDCGMKIGNTWNSNFNNIHLIDSGWNGLAVLSTAEKLNFNNINIQETGNIGLSVNGNEISIENTLVENAGSYGLKITGNNTIISNLKVDNPGNQNIIDGTSGTSIQDALFMGGGSYGLKITNSEDFILSSSQVLGNTLDGLLISDDNGACGNFIIRNNIIKENNNGITITSGGHEDFIITKNILKDNTAQDLSDSSGSVNKLVEDNLT